MSGTKESKATEVGTSEETKRRAQVWLQRYTGETQRTETQRRRTLPQAKDLKPETLPHPSRRTPAS